MMNRIKAILQLSVILLGILAVVTKKAFAEDIIISSNSGVVWEGLPWSVSSVTKTSYPQHEDVLEFSWAPVFISPSVHFGCSQSDLNYFKQINGVTGIRLTDHLIIVPVASGSVSYKDYYGKNQVIHWRSDTNGFYWNMPYDNNKEYKSPHNGYEWCAGAFPSRQGNNEKDKVFAWQSVFSSNGRGHWVIYADGDQTSGKAKINPAYLTSVNANFGYKNIIPSNFDVKVLSLKCTVNTPQTIDFGNIANSSTTPRSITGEVSVVCVQGSVPETRDVRLSARPVGGNISTTDTSVGVQIEGDIVGNIRGFIGEHANKEAGCVDMPSSLSFSYLNQYKLGGISINDQAKNFTQPLVWTFCPISNTKTGRATAAIELSATFK